MHAGITSKQNPLVKQVVALRERRERDSSSLFLIEGYRECIRARAAAVGLHTLLVSPEWFLGSNENALIQEIESSGVKVVFCSKEIFAKISYRDRPDGLLAIAHKMDTSLDVLQVTSSSCFLVAEAIEKPGNLGTMLRSADAAGASGVIVCDRCTDIYNPNVVRASTGTLFSLPVIETGTEEALLWLKMHGVSVVAATPHADVLFTEASLRGPIAIVVGTEQYGLSKAWMDRADIQVRIPMCGIADSLNVATATSLLLYEALRQRGF